MNFKTQIQYNPKLITSYGFNSLSELELPAAEAAAQVTLLFHEIALGNLLNSTTRVQLQRWWENGGPNKLK